MYIEEVKVPTVDAISVVQPFFNAFLSQFYEARWTVSCRDEPIRCRRLSSQEKKFSAVIVAITLCL
jgi:hypothetical protein